MAFSRVFSLSAVRRGSFGVVSRVMERIENTTTKFNNAPKLTEAGEEMKVLSCLVSSRLVSSRLGSAWFVWCCFCVLFVGSGLVLWLSCLVVVLWLSVLALTCRVVSCRDVSCLTVFCLALLCLALPCRVLSCLVLPCLALPCLVLRVLWFCFVVCFGNCLVLVYVDLLSEYTYWGFEGFFS